jgi:hypothetical protein
MSNFYPDPNQAIQLSSDDFLTKLKSATGWTIINIDSDKLVVSVPSEEKVYRVSGLLTMEAETYFKYVEQINACQINARQPSSDQNP